MTYDQTFRLKRLLSPRYWASRIPDLFGYHLVNWAGYYPQEDVRLVRLVRPRTMVQPLRLLSICEAVDYVQRAGIPGAWAECGVWRGGASLLAYLKSRSWAMDFWLYDQEELGASEALWRMGCPRSCIHWIPGDVLKTLPDQSPNTLAILRLDTNTYDTTLHELTHLYPRLSPGGVLLLDDWCLPGFRQAVREYFVEQRPFMARSDYTGALMIKPYTYRT